jgi:predicted small lipoprotein YifL
MRILCASATDLARFGSLLVALALAATACGQKGPLYLRDKPPPGVKPAKPPAPKPVPYPDGEPAEKNEPAGRD